GYVPAPAVGARAGGSRLIGAAAVRQGRLQSAFTRPFGRCHPCRIFTRKTYWAKPMTRGSCAGFSAMRGPLPAGCWSHSSSCCSSPPASWSGLTWCASPSTSTSCLSRSPWRPSRRATPVERWQLIVVVDTGAGSEYCLIDGRIDQRTQAREAVAGKDGHTIIAEGKAFPAVRLGPDEIRLLRHPDLHAVARLAGIYVAIVIGTFFLRYGQVYILHYTGQRIVHSIRQQIFSHLQRLPVQFFDRNPVGRLVTRVTNDTDNLNEMFTSVLVYLFQDIFLLLGVLVVMFRVHWQLALVSLAVMPLVALVTVQFRVRARDAYRQV